MPLKSKNMKNQLRMIKEINNHTITEIPICPKCGSIYMTKRGKRKKAHGKLQRWICPICHVTSTFPGPYLRTIRMPLKVALLILASHINGFSNREIKEECRKRYAYYISHTSISRYIKYVKKEGKSYKRQLNENHAMHT